MCITLPTPAELGEIRHGIAARARATPEKAKYRVPQASKGPACETTAAGARASSGRAQYFVPLREHVESRDTHELARTMLFHRETSQCEVRSPPSTTSHKRHEAQEPRGTDCNAPTRSRLNDSTEYRYECRALCNTICGTCAHKGRHDCKVGNTPLGHDHAHHTIFRARMSAPNMSVRTLPPANLHTVPTSCLEDTSRGGHGTRRGAMVSTSKTQRDLRLPEHRGILHAVARLSTCAHTAISR